MNDKNNLIKAKKALAEKYGRLAAIANSEPKRRAFTFKMIRYRRQLTLLGGSLNK